MASDLLPEWLRNHHTSASTAAAAPPHFRLHACDDGFTPSGCGGRPGKLVRDLPRSHRGAFRIFDGAVSERTADLLYQSAVQAKVWGVYVPTSELEQGDGQQDDTSDEVLPGSETSGSAEDAETYRRSLARRTVQEFLVSKATPGLIAPVDWARTHGVAVWVIASDCDDETEYHLDYAEQVRYETNVIVPPIYGATLHVSPLRNDKDALDCAPEFGGKAADSAEEAAERAVDEFEGGGFHVNVSGLDHYDAYGYKTRKKGKVTTDELETLNDQEPGWHRVAYKYRRGILCDGEFPHFSGRVRTLPDVRVPAADRRAEALAGGGDDLPMKRVVVGFNLFPHEIGAFVQKFPEHSSAFNKYVKLSQTAVKQTKLLSSEATWGLESVRKNPKQAAFIKFLAKKIKEKQLIEA